MQASSSLTGTIFPSTPHKALPGLAPIVRHKWASPDCTRVPAKLERWKLTLFRVMLIILAGLCAGRGAWLSSCLDRD